MTYLGLTFGSGLCFEAFPQLMAKKTINIGMAILPVALLVMFTVGCRFCICLL